MYLIWTFFCRDIAIFGELSHFSILGGTSSILKTYHPPSVEPSWLQQIFHNTHCIIRILGPNLIYVLDMFYTLNSIYYLSAN